MFVTHCLSEELTEDPLRVLMPKQQHWKLSMLMQFTIISFLGFPVLSVKDFSDRMEDNHRRLPFAYLYKLQQMVNPDRFSSLGWTYSFCPSPWASQAQHWYFSNNRLPSSRLYFIYNQDDSYMHPVRLSFTACDAFLYFFKGNSTVVIPPQVQTLVALSTAGWNDELWQLSTVWHSP